MTIEGIEGAEPNPTEPNRTGLTAEQIARLDAIRDQMSALDKEARQIVNATDEEKEQVHAMYEDDYGFDAADLLTETWGIWEDWLSQRECNAEDVEDQLEKEAEGEDDEQQASQDESAGGDAA